ncbi:ABC transporter substrate-binding protein [Sneathiella sp.]|uniref:ABC transporter substrate-binding protein n=1 Tax=Sneathiella sp. TaxID=1964365 RepID=UPI0035643D6C
MKPAVDKDTIVFATDRNIAMLDAQVDNTGNSDRYHWQLFDNLYTFDADGHLTPQIAKSYEESEDGLTYTFKIRDDVFFHNGAKLTAEDVKFSIERILDPKVKSTRRPYFAKTIKSVSVADDSTVVVTMAKRDEVFINKAAAFIAIVPKAYTESLSSPEEFAQKPVGAGPYKLVELKVGQYLELERFDQYYGEKPGIKHLIFKFISDATTRVNALQTGEVDMADKIASSDVARLKKIDGIDVLPIATGSPMHVRLYSNDPSLPIHDPRVRLALNYAIDANAIIENVMHGIGEPLSTFISKYYPLGVDPDLQPYGYNPDKARKLLAEAGYPNGFETTLMNPTSYSKDVAEAVVAYWSAVGVNAKLKILDYSAWARLNNTHKSGPMTVMQYSNAINDPITPISGTASKSGTWSDYDNKEVQDLIEKTNSVSDFKSRDMLFRQIGKILHDDAHSVLISEMFYVYGKNSQVDWKPQKGYAFYNLRTLSWK